MGDDDLDFLHAGDYRRTTTDVATGLSRASAVRHAASGGEECWFDITACAIADGLRVSAPLRSKRSPASPRNPFWPAMSWSIGVS
jgi:hypothetical protein